MTRRAFLLGLAMAAWVNLWPAYSSLIAHSSRADYAQLSEAFLVPFFCLLGLNLLLGPRVRSLSPTELLAISCMGMVAALMQGEWLSGYFLGIITAPTYFVTPENRWDDLLFQHIPSWSIVSNRQATIGFYESLPKDATIPWHTWVVPMVWWGGFLGAVLMVGFCLSVILRKQWMDHERLSFPIAAALLELTGISGSERTFSTLIRTRLFQIGFWVVLGAIAWNMIGWFVTDFPRLPVLSRQNISIGRGFPSLWFKVHPLTIAFGYFTKSGVLLSIWVFHILAIIQVGIFDRIGLDIGASDFICSFNPIIGWQSFGGMIVFVCWSLWIARDHLKEVLRKAFTSKGNIDDANELISYRAAVYLLLASALYLIFFLRQAGMAWGPVLAFWFATLILYLGLARIIVESGLIYLRGPITAQSFTWFLFGIAGMGPASTAGLALTYTFFCDAKTFGMTMFAHIPRLGIAMNPRRRRLLVPAVMLAALVGAATVIGFTLYYGYYVVGSYNFGVVSFNGSNNGAVGIWRTAANRIQEGTIGTDWNRVTWLGIGGAFTLILFYLRYLFPGFPVNPIGFAVSGSEILRSSTASIFLIWMIKVLLLKVGGLESYRRKAPLFLGMVVGYVAGIGLGVFVDVIWFNGNGHSLTGW